MILHRLFQLSMGALLLVIILAVPITSSAKKVFKWHCALGPIVTGSAYQFYQEEEIPRRVKEATAGLVEIITHRELVSAADVLDAVRDRRVDVGIQGTMYRGDMALFNYLTLPVIIPFESLPKIHAKVMPILEEEAMSKFNVELAGFGYWPRQLLISRRPAATFAELKGLKFRIHSQEILQLMKEAGGAPVAMPFGEVYLALQRGTIDGAVSGLASFRGQKWYEVAKYIDWWPMGNAGYVFLINRDAWNEIPVEMREVIKKTISEAELETWGKGDAEDKKLRAELQTKYQCEIIEPPASEIDQLRKMMTPVVDEWKKRAGQKSEEVMEIVNKELNTNY